LPLAHRDAVADHHAGPREFIAQIPIDIDFAGAMGGLMNKGRRAFLRLAGVLLHFPPYRVLHERKLIRPDLCGWFADFLPAAVTISMRV
jgi:hypothetical protein